MAVWKRKRPRLLSTSRPAVAKPVASLSSRKTRSLVQSHHALQKQLKAAKLRNDQQAVQEVSAKIDAAGGLSKYQEASVTGQSADRGGDSSKVLVEWFKEYCETQDTEGNMDKPLRMLEVGALSTDNACKRSGLFEIERIDLRSRHQLIKEEDFMHRVVPEIEDLDVDGFDVVSLSLVVNFVPDGLGRGEMLRRASNFLRCRQGDLNRTFPSLFLVLPAPCVTNSRYLDEERLEEIMKSLGYIKARRKMSAKLVYYLWRYQGHSEKVEEVQRSFKKEKIRSGASRNNFAVLLQ